MSSSSQSASPPVLSPSRISLFLPPKTTFNVPNTQVSLLVAECNSVRAAVATPRKTPPRRATPYPPSPTFSGLRAWKRPTPRCSAPSGRTALESGTCVSHFILRQLLGCAHHALPHSHGRPLEWEPRAGGARRVPRNLGAADAESAAQILLLVSTRASSEQPPSATSGASSDPRWRPGRPAGPPLPGQSCSAPGGSCRRGGWRGLGADRGYGWLRAARLIVRGGAPAARAAGGPAASGREIRRRFLAPAQGLHRAPPPSSACPLRLLLAPSSSAIASHLPHPAWAHLAGRRRVLGSCTVCAPGRAGQPAGQRRRGARQDAPQLRADP